MDVLPGDLTAAIMPVKTAACLFYLFIFSLVYNYGQREARSKILQMVLDVKCDELPPYVIQKARKSVQ